MLGRSTPTCGVDGDQAGNDPTRPETEVGLRTVKAGLGCHDAGASGVDEGIETASFPISKRSRLTWSELSSFSGFEGADNEDDSEFQNDYSNESQERLS